MKNYFYHKYSEILEIDKASPPNKMEMSAQLLTPDGVPISQVEIKLNGEKVKGCSDKDGLVRIKFARLG
jgi:hypothetical protein